MIATTATASSPAGPPALATRIVRYRDLVPCLNAFIDTRTPGSEAKENFTIIGPGVSENPNQFVHIAEPHGFNIGGARQPPNCVNSQHSHDTAEVFVVHSGRWRFDFGEHGEDASVLAAPGDTVSFPVNAFRGFTNVGDDVGFLWSVLGGDDPGRVLWAPRVFQLAKDYGLVLMENGALVDTTAGERLPANVEPMAPTNAEQIEVLRRITPGEAAGLLASGSLPRAGSGGLAGDGVSETPLIGDASPAEHLQDGPLGAARGFTLRRLDFLPGARTTRHRRAEAEVLFLHKGAISIAIDAEEALLEAGDTITVPIGAARSFASTGGAVAFVVRGADRPAAATILAA